MHVAHRLPSHSWESAVARFDVLAHEGMSAPCDASTTMTTEEVEEELMGSRGDVARRRRGVKGFLKRRDAWSAERITDRGEGIVGMGGRDVSAAAAAVLKPRSLIVKTLARWR